ncbi:MAG TPA: hypothetical protein VNL18_12495 [Gemmatimonadales bacterium]|nr:hypothetical protein [Gemmatimonadales bacterium]
MNDFFDEARIFARKAAEAETFDRKRAVYHAQVAQAYALLAIAEAMRDIVLALKYPGRDGGER